jgi:hypothetical protein
MFGAVPMSAPNSARVAPGSTGAMWPLAIAGRLAVRLATVVRVGVGGAVVGTGSGGNGLGDALV